MVLILLQILYESAQILFCFILIEILSSSQSVSGHPVAWVNNQFRQYIFDISDFLSSPSKNDNNITVSLESAWHYGLNVTARPDAEFFPGLGYVSISEKHISYPGRAHDILRLCLVRISFCVPVDSQGNLRFWVGLGTSFPLPFQQSFNEYIGPSLRPKWDT
jgi:hypothetical protein